MSLLGNKRDTPRQIVRGYFRKRHAIEFHCPRITAIQSREDLQKCGFARTVWTNQRNEIPDLNVRRNAVQNLRMNICESQILNAVHGGASHSGIVYWLTIFPDSRRSASYQSITDTMAHIQSENCTTMWTRWLRNAERLPAQDAIVHWLADGDAFRWTFAALVEAAEVCASNLLENGILPGEVCALIIRHHPSLYPLYLGCVRIGVIPAILAYPNARLHPDKFRQGLEGMSRRSGLDWILTERDLEPTIRPLIEQAGSTVRGVQFPLEWDIRTRRGRESDVKISGIHDRISASDPLLLQHSSGTTGLQKPVMLSHAAVQEHINRYSRVLRLDRDDRIVNWLPLYHDMGLIAAFHLPLALGIPTILINPLEWVMFPSILLDAVTRERGTISWLPNFAFDMMANKIRDSDLENVDLKTWRLVINCSEPVRHESHQKFEKRFQRFGLTPMSISTCYAMAEATFAVTQSAPESRPVVLAVNRTDLAKGMVSVTPNESEARLCVSSGTLIPGCEIRIVDKSGSLLPGESVGEFAIRSVSLFDGYRNYPEKTAEVLRDGWYFSGDLGFKYGADYFVIGRKKDIIIVAGTNIYPEDVESAISAVRGVIPGRVVAFGEDDAKSGTERLCVMVETEIVDSAEQRQLRNAILKAGIAIDVSITNIYLVPPRFLIKSSSGKPSRQANKARVGLIS
jgi:fatty-acyl-CoA synthase